MGWQDATNLHVLNDTEPRLLLQRNAKDADKGRVAQLNHDNSLIHEFVCTRKWERGERERERECVCVCVCVRVCVCVYVWENCERGESVRTATAGQMLLERLLCTSEDFCEEEGLGCLLHHVLKGPLLCTQQHGEE